jgi:hypothetical protein
MVASLPCDVHTNLPEAETAATADERRTGRIFQVRICFGSAALPVQIEAKACQFGRASAPTMPQAVQTIRGLAEDGGIGQIEWFCCADFGGSGSAISTPPDFLQRYTANSG